MTDRILRKKDYPDNYASDVIDIVDAMSFSKGKAVDIVGSMSLKSQQYAGDYDMTETVQVHYKSDATAVKYLVKQFQGIIRSLHKMKNVYIADIKAGEIPEWNVVQNVDGDLERLAEEVSKLPLSAEEYKEAELILGGVSENHTPLPKKIKELEKALRFHIVRWTPTECLQGYKTLRDGRHYTLQEAFTSPALFKLDVIALVQNNRYTDFSIIYTLKNNSHTLNNVPTTSQVEGLQQDVAYYLHKGETFKALKRMFSIARQKKDSKMIEALNGILNSDLGRIYSIQSDIGTLQYLLEEQANLPKQRILYEIDQFKQRLGNVYSINIPHAIVDELLDITEHPQFHREALKEHLDMLYDHLGKILNLTADNLAHKVKALPLKKGYGAE